MANQHTLPEPTSQKAQILAFVRAHPCCTTHDLRAALGYELDRTGMYLNRLQNAGLVMREKTPGTRLLRWSAVEEPDEADAAPIRILRTEWEPAQIAAQSWMSALGL